MIEHFLDLSQALLGLRESFAAGVSHGPTS